MTTAANVEAVVIITLRATSALARNVTTLEAVPPGQQATMQMLQGTRQHCSGEGLGRLWPTGRGCNVCNAAKAALLACRCSGAELGTSCGGTTAALLVLRSLATAAKEAAIAGSASGEQV